MSNQIYQTDAKGSHKEKNTHLVKLALSKGGGLGHFHYKSHSWDREYSTIGRGVLQIIPTK